MTILGTIGLAMMTLMALTAGVAVGMLILEGMLSMMRMSAIAVSNEGEIEMEPSNVVEFTQRSTGRLAAEPIALERAA